MARPLLIEFPRALYLVTSRGNSCAAISLKDPHEEVFLNLHVLDVPTGYACGKEMEFEWHAAKAEEDVRKHGVDFPTAARVFLDPYRIEREGT
jgi:hypothetical protein